MWLERGDRKGRLVEKEHRKHYLELGQALDGLQRPQNSEHPQGLDGLDVPPLVGSAGNETQAATGQGEIKVTFTLLRRQGEGGREAGKRPETGLE